MKKNDKQKDTVPVHVGIIMDGNGRWAVKKGLPRIAGHREGLKTVRTVVKFADECGVKYLTLYSFSTENWKRPEAEVKFLFSLMEQSLRKESEGLHKKNVKVRFIGSRDGLPSVLLSAMDDIAEMTRDNTGLTLIFAINYGSRQEITDAVKRIVRKKIQPGRITGKVIEENLYTAGIPALDLVIRTSGENRLSNFLLWQAAYAEFYFTPVLWPDFTKEEILKAMRYYQKRKRKFGAVL